MEKYAPLIFEECYVKHRGLNKIANAFEIEQDAELARKIDPHGGIKPGIFQQTQNSYTGLHLFVMQHGFQGNSFDMRTLKNMIAIAMPEAIFLCASSNEQDSDCDINDQGYKLAQEVFQFIRENCPGNQLSRITFIGHSMGGLIIRCALPYLDKFKDKMHGFVTLCTPHLGYMYKTSKLFSTGMWLLKKWKKSPSLT